MFRANQTSKDDLLLVSGEWVVGRVHPPGGTLVGKFNWSLTGPHTPVVAAGTVDTLEDAKVALLKGWRAWQA